MCASSILVNMCVDLAMKPWVSSTGYRTLSHCTCNIEIFIYIESWRIRAEKFLILNRLSSSLNGGRREIKSVPLYVCLLSLLDTRNNITDIVLEVFVYPVQTENAVLCNFRT